MDNRNGSRNPRRPEDLPYPFNTGYYVPVESLPVIQNPYIYDQNNPSEDPATAGWEENIQRVLGYVYSRRWPNLQTMVDDCKQKKRMALPGHYILDRAWTERDIETAARLRVWGVPNDVIEVIVGWPSVRPTEEDWLAAGLFMALEDDLIPPVH
ncbi:uncharacterized protein FIESC28_03942 [Fusarium coffeatum]|uniref:Uncharacterized protein n=1 Tax=Fusarium coffeatum TaxID=231269 RepID=A0A366S3F4_9HYPO|nr:uncharacterized protein FIESC28_03942 [Fusarium coffeatum]RBR23200.1 hypothetical protein FIESC28_03942 [Fusarium coffeatum]